MSKSRLALTAAVMALAVPGAAAAQTPSTTSNAAKTCKALRTAMNSAAAGSFNAFYGTNKTNSNAFGKCVSAQAKVARTNAAKAKNTCRAERDADAAAFAVKYGTNKNGKNAYGKCVSASAKKANEAETKNKVNAAKTCKAARTADPAAFAVAWGTKKNAFGKCVSATAKKKNDAA